MLRPLRSIVLTTLFFLIGSQLRAQTITASPGLPPMQSASLSGSGAIGLSFLTPLDLSQPFPYRSTVTIAPPAQKYPLKKNIVTTVFWVGEAPSGANATPNYCSSWDMNWIGHFGGVDDPEPMKRARDFRPAAFVPRQNPFYFALPYNDCINNRDTKAEAARVIPWFKKAFQRCGKSVCRDRWIAIQHGDRTCYAQWSDCGPYTTSDAAYVFGNARPSNPCNNGAGLDVSPAVRDYLGLKSGATCDWRFVEPDEIADGPWKNLGCNNPFSKDWKATPDESEMTPAIKAIVSAQTSKPKARPASGGIPGVSLRTVSKKSN